MTAKPILAAAAVACLALGGCSKSGEPAPEASASAAPVVDEASASAAALAGPSEIPGAMQGRWGLVPADCTSTAGDNKGMLAIGPMNMKFYESIARLTSVSEDAKTHLKATFAYSGEGMDWTRDVTLDLKDGGKTLSLQESGEDAVPGPRDYKRCD